MTTPTTKRKKRRGLAAMSPARRQAIARKGAKALHAQGKAHQFTTEEARDAALKRHEEAAPATADRE